MTFRDEIVIFRVLASNVRASRRFLRQLKESLKRDLQQEEILIVEKEAEVFNPPQVPCRSREMMIIRPGTLRPPVD